MLSWLVKKKSISYFFFSIYYLKHKKTNYASNARLSLKISTLSLVIKIKYLFKFFFTLKNYLLIFTEHLIFFFTGK